jgi:hypothetical protein
MSEELLTPKTLTQAVLRLYKLCNTFPLHFSVQKLNPDTICDTRESGTLYNLKKGRYFLLQLHHLHDQPIKDRGFYPVYTNDTNLHDHQQTFISSSRKPNINFLLGNYITYVFSMNRQFSKATVDKYFKRI